MAKRKKYNLKTDESIVIDNHKLFRVVAVKDFGKVKAGDLGGWIASEANLSHEGACWVTDEAMVYGDAVVCDDAIISGSARVYCTAKTMFCNSSSYSDGNEWRPTAAKVCGCSTVSDHATVRGMTICYNSHLRDNAVLEGRARLWNSTVCDDATVRDWANVANGHISEKALVEDHARIDGRTNPTVSSFGVKYPTTKIHGTAIIYGDAKIFGSAEVFGKARVSGKACVYHGAVVSGDAWLHGKTQLYKDISTGEYSAGKIFAFGCC